jgi:hypothetical protein
MTWLWYAYVSVPRFGRSNALRFTRAVYRHVMQGVDEDIPVIADELERSANRIVDFALTPAPRDGKPRAEHLARDLLLIIGNRRFCRHVAGKAPNLAIAIFRAVSEAKNYHLPLSQFASNLSTEALLNRDSLLDHEEHGFYSGYFGYPLRKVVIDFVRENYRWLVGHRYKVAGAVCIGTLTFGRESSN